MSTSVRRTAPISVVVGTVVVVPVLAFSRWGTYIGIAPIYLTDLLLAGVLFSVVFRRKPQDARVGARTTATSPSVIFVLFFTYVIVRALFSLGSAPLLVLLRDAVPFLYGVLAFVAASSYARSDDAVRAKTVRLLWIALIAHLIWVSAAVLLGFTNGFQLGLIFSAPVLQVRPDIDGAVLAATAGWCLHYVMLGSKHRFWALVGLIVSSWVVLTLLTRAGLLSLLLCLALSFALTFASTHTDAKRAGAMLLVLPVALAIIAIVVPSTAPGQRLLATVGAPASFLTSSQGNAEGTQQARELVWEGVIEWTNEETSRQLFGSGFGNDFLDQSGTASYLEGSTYVNVRSPHNWFIGVYARLGIVGTVLAIGVISQLFYLIIRNRRQVPSEPLLYISALIVSAIVVVATFGVVLEAPFGAVPFFWCAGLLYTLRRVRSNSPAIQAVSIRSEPR